MLACLLFDRLIALASLLTSGRDSHSSSVIKSARTPDEALGNTFNKHVFGRCVVMLTVLIDARESRTVCPPAVGDFSVTKIVANRFVPPGTVCGTCDRA